MEDTKNIAVPHTSRGSGIFLCSIISEVVLMNISEKFTLKQLQELLIVLKEQEKSEINTIDLVNQIKQSILTIYKTD
jgi:hypothetical protein